MVLSFSADGVIVGKGDGAKEGGMGMEMFLCNTALKTESSNCNFFPKVTFLEEHGKQKWLVSPNSWGNLYTGGKAITHLELGTHLYIWRCLLHWFLWLNDKVSVLAGCLDQETDSTRRGELSFIR